MEDTEEYLEQRWESFKQTCTERKDSQSLAQGDIPRTAEADGKHAPSLSHGYFQQRWSNQVLMYHYTTPMALFRATNICKSCSLDFITYLVTRNTFRILNQIVGNYSFAAVTVFEAQYLMRNSN